MADRFGYALAYDRDPAEALRSDYDNAVASPNLAGESEDIRVKYFEPNHTGLVALVECDVTTGRGTVLLELIVTGQDEQHITIEDISGTGG